MVESKFNNILTTSVIVIVFAFVIYYAYISYIIVFSIKKKDPRPYPKCPDYWESIGDGKCRNVHKIGKCRTGTSPNDIVNFDISSYADKTSGNYMKCKWAQDCESPWEKISDLC
jgi:hypothetical protein